jgi:hypothetical protein
VLQPLGTFLRVEGHQSKRIVLKSNDLYLAGTTVSLAEGTPPDAVSDDTATPADRPR